MIEHQAASNVGSTRRSLLRAGLPVGLAAWLLGVAGRAETAEAAGVSVVGSWQGTVRFVSDPPPGAPPTESVLLAFDASGTLVLTGSNAARPGIGGWRITGSRAFAFVLRQHLLNPTTGELIGLIHVRHGGTLDASGDKLTSSGTGQLHDLAGNPLAAPLSTVAAAARIPVATT